MQAVIDNVKSYIGLKKVSLGRVNPSSPDSPIRIFLNNKPFTQFAFLDQVMHTCYVDSMICHDRFAQNMCHMTSLDKYFNIYCLGLHLAFFWTCTVKPPTCRGFGPMASTQHPQMWRFSTTCTLPR